MALEPYIGFVGPSYTPESKIAAYDRTVNWYPEQIESGTGNTGARYVLYPTPGYATLATFATSPGRAIFALTGVIYVIYGASLYTIIGPVVTEIATGLSAPITDLEIPAQIVSNGDAGHQLLFRSATTLYAMDISTPGLPLVAIAGIVSNQIAYLDGYGLSLDRQRSEVRFSGIFDFSAWDALDVWQRSDAADKWQAIIVYQKEVWLFGLETTSVYYLSDDPNEPFVPIPSVFVQMGIAAPLSACVVNGSLFWVGRSADGSGVVYRTSGYTPVRISTHAVELALQRLDVGSSPSRLALGEAATYQENGHAFYELTFPSSDDETLPGATWVYDDTEGLWHERGPWDGLKYIEIPTRGHVASNGSQYTIDRQTGGFYLQSVGLSVGTDGLGIKRLRRAPHVNEAQRLIRYSRFRLVMETGLGLGNVVDTDPGYDPQMSLSWSDDGGQTFGNPITISAGKIGAFNTVMDWWQLGSGTDRVFELTCSAAVPWRLVNAFLDASVGAR